MSLYFSLFGGRVSIQSFTIFQCFLIYRFPISLGKFYSQLVFIVKVYWFLSGASCVAQLIKHLPVMGRPGFNSQVRKIPQRRKWHPTSVFLPGESHGQRSLMGCSSVFACIEMSMCVLSFTLQMELLFSYSVLSDCLRPYGLQHARLSCPSLSPRICADSCPLSQ